MSKRVPQRDLNMARMLIDVGQQLIGTATGLIDPAFVHLEDNWRDVIESLCFDVSIRLREHKRASIPIQLKGQRR